MAGTAVSGLTGTRRFAVDRTLSAARWRTGNELQWSKALASRSDRFGFGSLGRSAMAGQPIPSGPLGGSMGAAQQTEGLPLLYLEVSRGRTGFPLRPVRTPRFLIGSAEACQLRLGGSEMPAL